VFYKCIYEESNNNGHSSNVDSWSHFAREAAKLLWTCGQVEIRRNYCLNDKLVCVDSRSQCKTTHYNALKRPETDL